MNDYISYLPRVAFKKRKWQEIVLRVNGCCWFFDHHWLVDIFVVFDRIIDNIPQLLFSLRFPFFAYLYKNKEYMYQYSIFMNLSDATFFLAGLLYMIWDYNQTWNHTYLELKIKINWAITQQHKLFTECWQQLLCKVVQNWMCRSMTERI